MSAAARRRWRERIQEFRALGTLRGPLVDLVTAWARAWDAQRAAEKAWKTAGSPETQLGSLGQERRHRLAVAAERAARHLDGLTAKLERATFRRVPRGRVPDGARIVRRLEGGNVMILNQVPIAEFGVAGWTATRW